MSRTGNTTSRGKMRFFSGVMALTLSNLFVKVVGLALKIPLRNILTDVGMTYYNNAYDIYAWLFTIATTGLPTAISLIISEDRARGNKKEIKKVFRVVSVLFIAIGLIGTSIMLFGAPLFEKAYKINNSTFCIMAVAPTMLFICIASSFRGYFQGYQLMTPTAVSEVTEAVGKMVLGLLFARYAVNAGCEPYEVAAYAALGLTLGTAAGMLTLVIRKLVFNPDKSEYEFSEVENGNAAVRSTGRILVTLVTIAIPITISSSVLSLSAVIDGIVLSRRLQSIGLDEQAVTTMIGNYKTCAVPLANLPPALVAPITSSIIPMISSSIASGNRRRAESVMNGALMLTAIVELPCALGMSVLAEPIITLLFGSDETILTYAVPLLRILALSVFFSSMMTMTCAFLQAYRHGSKPILSMLAGAVVKVVLLFVLVGSPEIGIFGCPVASILGGFAISAVNLIFIKKYIGFVPDFRKIMLRPLLAAAVCAVTAMFSYKLFGVMIGKKLALFPSIALAAVVYFLFIFIIKALEREDVMLLPKGEKLCVLLEKLHLLKPTNEK